MGYKGLFSLMGRVSFSTVNGKSFGKVCFAAQLRKMQMQGVLRSRIRPWKQDCGPVNANTVIKLDGAILPRSRGIEGY